MTVFKTASKALLPLAGAFALAACGGETEEPTYETDVVDQSGGELIVTDPEAERVDVQLPETPMTPVPPTDGSTETPEPSPETADTAGE